MTIFFFFFLRNKILTKLRYTFYIKSFNYIQTYKKINIVCAAFLKWLKSGYIQKCITVSCGWHSFFITKFQSSPSISIRHAKTPNMLKLSIKSHKSCIICASNSKKFYHWATTSSYFYDGIVTRWYFLKNKFFWVLGFYLGIGLYYFFT